MKVKILDLIYPPRCIVCENILEFTKHRWFCENCKEVLTLIEGHLCKKCGVPTNNDVCTDCKNRNLSFKKNYPILEYDEITKNIIHKFKYFKEKEIGEALALYILEKTSKDIFKNINILTPVPIHKNRLKKRGFNQAEILCKHISKNIDIPMMKDLLMREKDTKSQNRLTPIEREKNLKGAFIFNKKYNVKGKNIMIIDDIYTTGRTITECSNILLNNNCKEAYSLTISIVVKKTKNVDL